MRLRLSATLPTLPYLVNNCVPVWFFIGKHLLALSFLRNFEAQKQM